MAQPKLSDVEVPLLAHINGMFPGRIIVINGTVEPDAKRFSINFMTAADDGADNAFHFNPRLNEGVVVRNTKEDGNWQDEQREGDDFNFEAGEPFEISIKCRKKIFKVRVNGKCFCDYHHRIPLHKIAYLVIRGGVTVQNVDFQQDNKLAEPTVSLKNPEVGEKLDVPFRNIRGHTIQIIGKPTGGERFVVNFLTEEDDVAFHLNPRFSEDAIVRNSKLEGGWGDEERDISEGFPFAANSPFVISIDVDKEGFKVKLNGVHQFDYAHRVKPIKKIRAIQLAQDGAEIREINFY